MAQVFEAIDQQGKVEQVEQTPEQQQLGAEENPWRQQSHALEIPCLADDTGVEMDGLVRSRT